MGDIVTMQPLLARGCRPNPNPEMVNNLRSGQLELRIHEFGLGSESVREDLASLIGFYSLGQLAGFAHIWLGPSND